MRRSLVLTVDSAAPPVSGADLRNWQNAVALARLGPVKLVSFRPLQRSSSQTDAGIECVALTEANAPRNRAVNRRQSSLDVAVTRPTITRLQAIIAEFRPDTVVVEGIALFPLLEHLSPRVPNLVLDMHNIESDLRGQTERQSLSSRLLAVFKGGDQPRIRKLEHRAIEIVDRVWVCSESDKRRLESFIGSVGQIDVVPNAVPRPAERLKAVASLHDRLNAGMCTSSSVRR
jgi:hypothetical protein